MKTVYKRFCFVMLSFICLSGCGSTTITTSKSSHSTSIMSTTNEAFFEFHLIQSEQAYAIKKYIGKDKAIRIPSYFKEAPVIEIADTAFYGQTDLTHVEIPSTIRRIGSGAFVGCMNLSSLSLPDTILEIQSYAFAGCSSLLSLDLPDSLLSIGEHAFLGCTNVKEVTLPPLVEIIPQYAFAGCSELVKVSFSQNLKRIDQYAFVECKQLKQVTLPQSLQLIGAGSFERCTSLEKIHYQGTTSQWDAIVKGMDWNLQTGDMTIFCQDGVK